MRRCAPAGGGVGRAGALAAAVGAAHRLPGAARLGVARRNSLRELRSDNRRESEGRCALRAPTPRLRCSAPQTSPRTAPRYRLRARIAAIAPRPLRPPRRPAQPRPGPLPPAARQTPTVYAAKTGGMRSMNHDADGKGAGRPPPARLCAAEKRSGAGPRAQRASLSDSPRMSERSSRSERSEFRGGAGAASIAGHPRAAGASTGAPAAGGPRLCPRLCPRQPRHAHRGTRWRTSAAAN